MTVSQAIKEGRAIKLEFTTSYTTYLLDDGRIIKYDRFWGPRQNRAMWVDEEGRNAYVNFNDAYEGLNSYAY